ncbi:MAG: hypothetical protein M1155_02335 [Patescibacteria group bacterium]|nr:hypothetical protein [Patescibacteria group bacterium]
MAEVKRVFRLSRLPSDIRKDNAVLMRQGYLIFDDDTELKLFEIEKKYFMECRSTDRSNPQEWKIEIPFWVFGGLWFATHGIRISKRFYAQKSLDNFIFKFSVFEGLLRGLVLLEIEFPDKEAADRFKLPEDFIVREVTDDERYGDQHLAIFGIPD